MLEPSFYMLTASRVLPGLVGQPVSVFPQHSGSSPGTKKKQGLECVACAVIKMLRSWHSEGRQAELREKSDHDIMAIVHTRQTTLHALTH